MESNRLRRATVGVLAAVCLAAGYLASPAEAGATKVQSIEGITEYQLDNGLRVLLYPDDSKPTVTVNLTVLVGSRHEGYGETGMAHLLEHMVFKGTPTHADDSQGPAGARRALQRHHLGRPHELLRDPAGQRRQSGFALDLEADRLVNSFVKQEDLLSEMTVVRNEFERGENSPQQSAQPADDGGRLRLAQLRQDRRSATAPTSSGCRSRTCRTSTSKYYQPDNCMLVDRGQVRRGQGDGSLVEKYFGKLPKPTRKLDKTYTEEPPQDGERSVTLRRVGDVGLVAAAYHIPSGGHPDTAALDVLASILSVPPSGRLYKALVETKKATDVSASAIELARSGRVRGRGRSAQGRFARRGQRHPARRHRKGRQHASSPKKKSNGPSSDLLKQRELAAADTGRIAVQLSDWASQGDWRLYFLHRDRIEKVTPQDVQARGQEVSAAQNRTLGMFIPTDKSEKSRDSRNARLWPSCSTATRAARRSPGRSLRRLAGQHRCPHPAHATLPEGIKVALLPKKTRGETVNLRLVLRYGTPDCSKAMKRPPSAAAADDARHQEPHAAADPGRAGQEPGHADRPRATWARPRSRCRPSGPTCPPCSNCCKQILREPTLPAEEFEVFKRQQLSAWKSS